MYGWEAAVFLFAPRFRSMLSRWKQGRDVSKLWLRFFYEDFCDGIFCSKHSSIVAIKRKKIKKRDENGIVF